MVESSPLPIEVCLPTGGEWAGNGAMNEARHAPYQNIRIWHTEEPSTLYGGCRNGSGSHWEHDHSEESGVGTLSW